MHMRFTVKYAGDREVVIINHLAPKQEFDNHAPEHSTITFHFDNSGPNALVAGDQVEFTIRKVVQHAD